MANNIYLIGFMGSGKSTIGKELASHLGLTWVDLDYFIEANEKMTIKELFEKYGEAYFRNLETLSLKKLAMQKNLVVSTGGGVIVTPENIILLKEQKTIYLKWDFETLFDRIAHDENRPLVKSHQQLLALYESRQKMYHDACSKVVLGDGKSILSIIEEIISK